LNFITKSIKICQFAIFFIKISILWNIYIKKRKKGDKMSLLIKNAETLFEKFEYQMEIWAEKLF